jgi:phage gp36-like protein
VAGPLEFEVAGVSRVIYVRPKDVFESSIPQHALQGVESQVMARACIEASSKAHGFFARRYTGPLVSWDSDVRRELAQIVAYMVMSHRGFAPDGTDELIVKNHNDALKWLGQVGSGAVSPDIGDSTPARSGSGARVYSRSSRCERVGDEDC